MLNMGAAAVGVDVVAVGFGIDNIGLGTQSVKDSLGDLPGSAVGAIQAHLYILEAVLAHGDQVSDVAVAARNIVHGTADVLPLGNGDLDLAVNEVLNLQDRLLIHLLAVAVEKLDAVIIVGVMGGRDHDAAIEIVHPGDIGNGRGRGDMHDVSVSAAGHESRAERIFKHVGAAPGILADDDFGLFALIGAIIPAQETADLNGMLIGQILIGLSAEAVGSEILAHLSAPPSIRQRRYPSRWHWREQHPSRRRWDRCWNGVR